MRKMVLGLMVVAGLLGTSTVVANAADTDSTGNSTGDVSFSSGKLSMSVDSVNLSFKKSEISADTAPLKAVRSPTVTVNDLRGNNAGWLLTVTQENQFSTKSSSVLNDATLTVVAQELSGGASGVTTPTQGAALVPGTAARIVASASAGGGNGFSQFKFSGSTLSIPSTTARLANQEYTTTLTWNLRDAPSNN